MKIVLKFGGPRGVGGARPFAAYLDEIYGPRWDGFVRNAIKPLTEEIKLTSSKSATLGPRSAFIHLESTSSWTSGRP